MRWLEEFINLALCIHGESKSDAKNNINGAKINNKNRSFEINSQFGVSMGSSKNCWHFLNGQKDNGNSENRMQSYFLQ